MKLKNWLMSCVALTLPSLALSAAAVVMSGGLYQRLEDKNDHIFEQKMIGEIASNRETIDRLSEQLRIQSPADYGHNRIEARIFMINSQLAQAPEPIVIVGDSITEAALFPSEICGHPVINAGIGGATPISYISLVRYRGLLEQMHASLIVIALGTNNAQTIKPLTEFEPSYRALVKQFKPQADKIVFAGVPAIGEGIIAQYFDATRVAKINSTIKDITSELDSSFIDLGEPETIDGVHLTASGYKAWLHSLERSARKELSCSPTAEAH